MSGTEESDPEWKEKNPKRQTADSSFKNSLPVQKFCDNWLKIFSPWLTRCADNPNKPFCRACQCRLDCNRCHLQRHEGTSKHARNLVILLEKGEEGARENYSLRQERSKYYQQRKQTKNLMNLAEINTDIVKEENDEEDFIEDGYDEEETFDYVQADTSEQYADEPSAKPKHNIQMRNSTRNTSAVTVPQRKTPATLKKERMRLYMQIQKDKSDLMCTFNELISAGNKTVPSPSKDKNHVDLFFESVSSSVKALSPKLIAEAKMRVSQLICELELRALTEGDSNNTADHAVAPGTIVVSPSSGNSYVLHRTAETQRHHEEQVAQDYEAIN